MKNERYIVVNRSYWQKVILLLKQAFMVLYLICQKKTSWIGK